MRGGRRDYTDESTARVIREGIDADGRKLSTLMPRFQLGDADMAALIAYLKSLDRAVERGLRVKPWVKTSFAPGSTVVSDYLKDAGLMASLDAVGFNLTGYGCTVCIGNAGPLPPHGREPGGARATLARHPHRG